MFVASIGKQWQYVNSKHIYYIFCYIGKMNYEDDKFIHSPSFYLNEVKQLLIPAQIIKVNSYGVLQTYDI
jgi:hypothetical protein